MIPLSSYYLKNTLFIDFHIWFRITYLVQDFHANSGSMPSFHYLKAQLKIYSVPYLNFRSHTILTLFMESIAIKVKKYTADKKCNIHVLLLFQGAKTHSVEKIFTTYTSFSHYSIFMKKISHICENKNKLTNIVSHLPYNKICP